MRVRVEESVCQGHGQCNLVCPEVFQFDEQGFARVVHERVPEGLESEVERAANGCPEHAVEIER